MGNFNNLIYHIGVLAILLLAGPFAFIWGVNTLIAAAMAGAPAGTFVPYISFSFWTWLAAVFVGGLALIPKARRGG